MEVCCRDLPIKQSSSSSSLSSWSSVWLCDQVALDFSFVDVTVMWDPERCNTNACGVTVGVVDESLASWLSGLREYDALDGEAVISLVPLLLFCSCPFSYAGRQVPGVCGDLNCVQPRTDGRPLLELLAGALPANGGQGSAH